MDRGAQIVVWREEGTYGVESGEGKKRWKWDKMKMRIYKLIREYITFFIKKYIL